MAYENLNEAREEALLDLYERIETLPVGSEEHLRAAQAIAQLEKALSERYKADSEYDAKRKASEMESESNTSKNKTEFIMKGLEIGAKVVMTAGQLYVFSDQLSKSRAFEQSGIEACSSFKKIWSGFKPFNVN